MDQNEFFREQLDSMPDGQLYETWTTLREGANAEHFALAQEELLRRGFSIDNSGGEISVLTPDCIKIKAKPVIEPKQPLFRSNSRFWNTMIIIALVVSCCLELFLPQNTFGLDGLPALLGGVFGQTLGLLLFSSIPTAIYYFASARQKENLQTAQNIFGVALLLLSLLNLYGRLSNR